MAKKKKKVKPKRNKWIMPEWMKPFEKYINNTGGNPIEELVNDDGTNSNVFNNAPRALICCAVKCEVHMLEAMHADGLLLSPSPELLKLDGG